MSEGRNSFSGQLPARCSTSRSYSQKARRVLCTTLLVLGTLLLALGTVSTPLVAQTYTDMHDFNCLTEGCYPNYPAVLAQGRDGNLYGTLSQGGTSNMGTVFKVTPSGTLKTIHSFSGADGQTPYSGLTLGPDGNFYGTTLLGGTSNNGTIFKITPSGVLTTLHSFAGGDGASPHGAPVLGKNGSFYGTTCSQFGPWTAYSITASGTFKLLSSSVPPCPFGPLALASDGNFYGASQVGGTTSQGTVFRLTPAGAVTIIHSFDYTDGAYLYSPVVQGADGLIYGTTSGGGSGQAGVIFKVSPGGTFTLLHQWDANDPNDGSSPFAGLVAASDGNFYGATSGGTNSGSTPDGTLFKITRTGAYSVLYAFDGTHGSLEQATPTQHTNGKFYGLDNAGGAFANGALYSFDMGLQPFVSVVTLFGSVGQNVQILGNGLTGTTAVHFGSASASFTVVSDTNMTATIPTNATTGNVTVTTPSGTLTSNKQFRVVPTITAIAPTSGPVGTQVTITGSGLLGATQVTFGGVTAASYTVNSASKITATVPTGAVTGKVGVKTPGGTANSSATFTVTP